MFFPAEFLVYNYAQESMQGGGCDDVSVDCHGGVWLGLAEGEVN